MQQSIRAFAILIKLPCLMLLLGLECHSIQLVSWQASIDVDHDGQSSIEHIFTLIKDILITISIVSIVLRLQKHLVLLLLHYVAVVGH